VRCLACAFPSHTLDQGMAMINPSHFSVSFLWWGETESAWDFLHSLAYCTSPGWWMIMCEVAIGGMTRKGTEACPVLLSPPQMPHALTCARTLVAAVGNLQLTRWAKAWPPSHLLPLIRSRKGNTVPYSASALWTSVCSFLYMLDSLRASHRGWSPVFSLMAVFG
jgi:hypothetical protein